MQFSFSFTTEDVSSDRMLIDMGSSHLKLNKEWNAVCFWKGNSVKCFKPLHLEFHRVSAADTITISGNLWTTYFEMRRKYLLNQNIFNFMKSGSSAILIYVRGDIYETFSKDHRLHVDVTISSSSNMLNGECRKHVPLVELSNDLGRLLDPEISCFADVNLKCGDVSIPAHKNILSARSPVFAAMFRNPMKEARENEVVISDVDATVLRQMLAYMYTAKLSILTVPSASDLLFAADKYQLGDLKTVCCEFLKGNISHENVLRILLLGEQYCSDLKSFAIDYISQTYTELSFLEKTEGWETLRKERPDLGMDILRSVLKAREKKDKK